MPEQEYYGVHDPVTGKLIAIALDKDDIGYLALLSKRQAHDARVDRPIVKKYSVMGAQSLLLKNLWEANE